MDGESPSAPSGATSSTSPARDQFVHTLHAFARGMLEARTVDDLLWDVAARTIAHLLRGGFPDPHTCLNINIPRCETEDPTHADPIDPLVCRMNTHGLVDRYEKRTSPSGDDYYWPNADGMEFRSADDGTDVERLFERCITVTPLRYDLTDDAALERWRSRV